MTEPKHIRFKRNLTVAPDRAAVKNNINNLTDISDGEIILGRYIYSGNVRTLFGIKGDGEYEYVDAAEIQNYNINGHKISDNPKLQSSDINIGEKYLENTGNTKQELTIVSADTIDTAMGKLSKYITNIDIKVGNNSTVSIQNDEPVNKNVLWVEPTSAIGDTTNSELVELSQQVKSLSEIVAKHDFALTGAMVCGDSENSTKLSIINSATPIAPDNAVTSALGNVNFASESGDSTSGFPDWTEGKIPNLNHFSLKSTKFQTMQANKSTFINFEPIWCYDINKLYILSQGNFKLVGGAGTTTGGTGLDLNAIDNLYTIGLIAPNGQVYRVKSDNSGNLIAYKKELDVLREKPTAAGTTVDGWNYAIGLYLPKLYINSLYCGGITSNEHSYNYCSHNYIELSNLTNNDISLSGISLQYGTNGSDWQVLPLWGNIKAGSTFLIRGAQCSVMDANTTRIKIKNYDMEWYGSDGKLINFSNTKAKFLLTCGNDACGTSTPYYVYDSKDSQGNSNSIIQLWNGYIDFVGLNKPNPSDVDKIDNYEQNPYQYLDSNKLLVKYYSMDSVSQATKALTARDNSKDWYFVQLDKDIIPNVESYTPKASYENKNIFYNKTLLNNNKPNLVNITFGIQATAPNATRCFNWVSVGYYDEYLWYRIKDTTEWIKVESFKNETGIRSYYNRIRSESTDGTPFTTHKCIIKNLLAGIYEYKVGRDDSYISDIYTFTVRNGDDINNDFTFVQVSDQQGFNRDEYQVWKSAADYIKNNITNAQFTINTGDMTQNGNRINEWLDYYDGRKSLKDIEEMCTIGNNDLCPSNLFKLGTGEDNSKLSPKNMSFFYTFEIDETNPPIFNVENKDIYIDSLYSFNYGNTHFMCVNSELTEKTETEVYGLSAGKQMYDYVSGWCKQDLAINTGKTWNIAFCHEMPFTIITQNNMNAYYYNNTEYASGKERSGSHMNTINTSQKSRYWFSRFCQENNIRLVIGGHKHTYSVTYPLKETIINNEIISMKPTIQVTLDDLKKMFGENCTGLYTETEGVLKGFSYPITWKNNTDYDTKKHFCNFELADKITAPIYAMCQATGYKHTSNKELPGPSIPWLAHYFAASVTSVSQTNVTSKVNKAQKYPFYIIWNITPTQITGTVKKINNIFDSAGLFNINMPNANTPIAIGGNGTDNNGNNLIKILK